MWKEIDNSLYKKFEFNTFDEAVDFINSVAIQAKLNNHHPKIINVYNLVEIFLSTHSAGSKVTERDRLMAESIDAVTLTNNSRSKSVKRVKVYTDGGSRGNPGPSATGYVILDLQDSIIEKGSRYLGITTNNQAEYMALVDALKKCEELKIEEVNVHMDSLLIVNQINGQYKVKNAELVPLYQEVKSLQAKFKNISFIHVRRELNSIADGLVNKCLDDNK